MSDNKNKPLTEERAIAILDEVTRSVNWMERLADELKAAITAPGKLAETVESYVVTKRVNDMLEEGRKLIGAVAQEASYKVIPDKMADEDISTFTSRLGYRVTVSQRFSASMLDKERGFDWLRAHDLGDLIQPTVNAQTLSAQARRLVEEENIELPEDIFKTSIAPYVSVTAVRKK